MPSFLRHCVECPKCLTRYLIAFSPYRNGSCLIPTVAGSSEEYLLYCSCGRPPAFSRWRWHELMRCVVSKAAHARGFGTSEEVVQVGDEQRIEIVRANEIARSASDRQKRKFE
jgi:hypothetical protein